MTMKLQLYMLIIDTAAGLSMEQPISGGVLAK